MTQDSLAAFGNARLAHFANPRAMRGRPAEAQRQAVLSPAAVAAAAEQIGTWPGYEATPLMALPGLAGAAGLEALWYKDEGGRFGLGSFKALGGAYAVSSLLADQLEEPSRHFRGNRRGACAAGATVT